jgi:eIF4-gamma/eIF5/eIF2-epsilon
MAQLAEEERNKGPPQVRNPRMAQMAEAERNQGPPPATNSRFAQAAALAAQEDEQNDRRRSDNFGRDDRRNNRSGPPPQQNTRFLEAAAADADYVSREERMQRGGDRFGDGPRGGDRFGDGRRDDHRRGGEGRGWGRENDNYNRGPRDGRDRPDINEEDLPRAPKKSLVDEILKPKAAPVVDNFLVPPKLDPQQEANILKIPAKALSKQKDDDVFIAAPAKKEEPPAPEEVPEPVADQPAHEDVDKEALIEEFCKGDKQGEELAQWAAGHKDVMPRLDLVVYRLLTDHEKLNPDPDCLWAGPSRFGAALLSLAADDDMKQMEILFGVQKYCNSIGFPKLNEEYVVQSMFRSMYKFDLALEAAFAEWKEDESDEYEEGKTKAVVQTMDWFAWLEQEEDEDEEEDEDGDYEEE